MIDRIKEFVESGQRAQAAVDALTAPAPNVVIKTREPYTAAAEDNTTAIVVREWICVLKRRDARALPIGTRVLVVRDDGTMLETVTLAPPRDLGGQPVVDVHGIAGPYCMHRVYCAAG